MAAYDGEIRYWDTHFGNLMRYIEDIDLKHPPAIFITSDHGESMTERNYYFEHGAFLYEGTVRIPLMVRLERDHPPGIFPGHVRLMDLSPTVLDYLQLPPLENADGKSFNDVFCTNDQDVLDFDVPLQSCSPALHMYRSRGVISGSHKFIDYADDEIQADEVFDRKKDPGETRSILNIENGTLIRDLHARTSAFFEQDYVPHREPRKSRQIIRSDAVEVLKTLGYIDDESELAPDAIR